MRARKSHCFLFSFSAHTQRSKEHETVVKGSPPRPVVNPSRSTPLAHVPHHPKCTVAVDADCCAVSLYDSTITIRQHTRTHTYIIYMYKCNFAKRPKRRRDTYTHTLYTYIYKCINSAYVHNRRRRDLRQFFFIVIVPRTKRGKKEILHYIIMYTYRSARRDNASNY